MHLQTDTRRNQLKESTVSKPRLLPSASTSSGGSVDPTPIRLTVNPKPRVSPERTFFISLLLISVAAIIPSPFPRKFAFRL